ncbi:helix-turn-helix transcriptional regulator [Bradyrhizobium amphicarpaeae]|uniref:LuxR family transcriptional regulator n=1 Tax=Bradyrhizobium amphicarpaeae TaxID=1404768 RepID=A0A2U8PWL7_9BRAD|nr:helix-turn-helix transcriptional regulator [Bradyrhizobium amphicarpaeae]AWM02203.1 LuxR family transcriptional regulator [Bradyrhizobium amphicarpaeae]
MNAMLPLPATAVDAATLADTLDGLDIGLYLVAADARLVHANTAGRAILAARDILRDVRGHLVACDGAANHVLQRLFAAPRLAGETAVPMIGADGQRFVAHALPLASEARLYADEACRASAALFVRKVALTIPPCSDVIGQVFRLTPTELRVLLAIVELGSVRDVAAAFGVAGSTIKTHLRRLFEKTGAARQADFVKLVAGYATPLRSTGEPR